MKIFITGATGYIGSEVAKALKNRGHEVVGLVRSRESARKLEALGGRPVSGDMREPEAWKPEAAKAEALIHLAVLGWKPRYAGLRDGIKDVVAEYMKSTVKEAA